MKRQKAFTLVELVIVISLTAILLGIGIPSFRTLIQNNRLTSHANEFVATLNLARSEAIKRGTDVQITAMDSSDAGDEWGKGWTVWVDLDGDTNLDPAEALRIVAAFDDSTTLNSLDANEDQDDFTYQSNGALRLTVLATQTMELCDNVRAGETGRRIRIAPGGYISMYSNLTCP